MDLPVDLSIFDPSTHDGESMNTLMMHAGLKSVISMIDNLNSTTDPVVRYMLLIKIIRFLFEIGINMGEASMISDIDHLAMMVEMGDQCLPSVPPGRAAECTRTQNERVKLLKLRPASCQRAVYSLSRSVRSLGGPTSL